MREISEISIQSLGETFELADATARKFGVNTVYPIDIDKRGSGNNILYITVPGVESYDDMDGKSVALNTGIYCVQWDEPQTVYININGLGSKALYRPLPTNASADYDDRQYNTAKYVKGEISRQQTLIVSFRKDGSVVTATLLNPAPAPRATKEIAEDSSDDVSYVTPKAVSVAMRGTIKNPIHITKEELDKTWQPGWYMCQFNLPDETYGKPEHLVQVTNSYDYDNSWFVSQVVYDYTGEPQLRRCANNDGIGPEDVLDNYSFGEWRSCKYAAKGIVTQDNLDNLTNTGIYYPGSPEPDSITVNDTIEMLIVSQQGVRPVYQMALTYSDNDGYRIFVRSKETSGWTAWQDIHEQGTYTNPIRVTPEELDKTWKPGVYVCRITPPDADFPCDNTIEVTNWFDEEDQSYNLRQLSYMNGSFFRRLAFSANAKDYSQVLNFDSYDSWEMVVAPRMHASRETKYGKGNANLYGHLKLSDIINNSSGVNDGIAVTPKAVFDAIQGTWTNPFVVSDPKTDLSTLTTPGIYYFDFEEEVYAIAEPYGFGCYTKGYMQVAGLWNDQFSKNVVGQTLYVYNEGQFYSCTREVNSNSSSTNWRVSAWVTDITKIDLDGRVKTLENAKGTWAKPYIISQPETRLSTLINPGVYRFMIDDTAATELKGRGFYRGGYMEVAPVWGDNTGGLIYFQKIYTGYEGKVWIYTRTIQGKGVEENDDSWQMVETSGRKVATPSLESRIETLEKQVKALGG